MKRVWTLAIPMILAIGAGVMLRADEGSPLPSGEIPKNAFGTADSVWTIEHYAYISKDPEAMGILAAANASELLKPQGPTVQIDFLQKMLYMTKSAAVERSMRIQLAQLYHQTGQDNKAMEQYQMLITGGN